MNADIKEEKTEKGPEHGLELESKAGKRAAYYLDAKKLQKPALALIILGLLLLSTAFLGFFFDESWGSRGGGGHAIMLPSAELNSQSPADAGAGANGEDALPVYQAASSSSQAEMGMADSKSKFFAVYLFSYVFFMSLTIGCLFFVILQHLTRSQWSAALRRIPESFLPVFPFLALLSLPILFFGMSSLYHWTDAAAVETDVLLQAKAPYLNNTFFYLRFALYMLFFILISRFYYKKSVAQDTDGSHKHTRIMQKASPLATLFFALITTFFSLDMLMSLDPHWYSTIFGVYFFAGSMLGALSLIILVLLVLRVFGWLKQEVNKEHYHDLGKLLFTFNLFWSYIAFSQYMLIWYANIPETTLFFIKRLNGSWKEISILLLVGHVFIPILILVSRNVKRNLGSLGFFAFWIMLMHALDLYWIIMPNTDVLDVNIGFSDMLVFFGMAAMFFGVYILILCRHAIMPIKDPYLKNSLDFENA